MIQLISTLLIAAVLTLHVRTADPIKREFPLSDFPRTMHVIDNVYTYAGFHAGDENFTTTDRFVVTDHGAVVVDAQGSPAETKGLLDAIAKITPQPIKVVVIASDHGDHTAGDTSLPPGANTRTGRSASSQSPIAVRRVYAELSGALK